MGNSVVLLSFLFQFLIASSVHSEALPPLITYQGMLLESGGVPMEGAKKLSFSLYEGKDGQVPKWGPQIFDLVPLVHGRFTIILGSTDTAGRLLPDLTGPQEIYLSISADGVEISPRQRLLSALSSLSPPLVQNVAAPTDNGTEMPVATIVAYWSDQIPKGWLLCDGSPVPEGEQYDTLRTLTKGNLPDLRGLFLRGIGQNSDPAYRYEGDSSRHLFEFQQDSIKTHSHDLDDFTFSESTGVAGKAWGNAGSSDIDNSPGSPFRHSTLNAGSDETRPKNAAVNWIIKY